MVAGNTFENIELLQAIEESGGDDPDRQREEDKEKIERRESDLRGGELRTDNPLPSQKRLLVMALGAKRWALGNTSDGDGRQQLWMSAFR